MQETSSFVGDSGDLREAWSDPFRPGSGHEHKVENARSGCRVECTTVPIVLKNICGCP